MLGLPRWGTTRGRSPRQLGSVLCEQDAAAGLNFVSLAVKQLYDARHAAGWGIDPSSMAYMTSSQALTINLFGLLSQDDAWLLRCLNEWLGRVDLTSIDTVELEFAPARRSQHLNDQTRIDVLVVVAGARGTEVVAIEIKYTDRFNSRYVDISTPSYRELAMNSGIWADPTHVLTDRRVNQLTRIHALATSHGLSLNIRTPVSLLVLAHELDTSAGQIVNKYRECVTTSVVQLISLRTACESIATTAPPSQRTTARLLQLRYGDEHVSAWPQPSPRSSSLR